MAASESSTDPWTESGLILHERGFKRCCYKDNLRLLEEEYKIKSLEDLIQFKPKENHRETLSTGLLTEIRKIKGEYESGAVFLTTTSPSWPPNANYTHWIPTNKSRLLDKEPSEIEKDWQSILETDYEEFDTICHVTHMENALEIFKENKLRSRPVADSSVFSKVPEHPNRATEVIWFGPAKKEKISGIDSRYGNVAFFMERLEGYEGIRRDGGYWKYYFVEVVDYKTSSACRILVTHKSYPHLRPYDPTEKGGPWYYDVQTRKDYWLKDIKRWDETRGPYGNSVEFMREESYSGTAWHPHINRKNLHFCSVKHANYCLKTRIENCDQFSNKDTRLLIMNRAYLPDFKPETDFMDDTAKEALNSFLHDDKIELPPANLQADVMEDFPSAPIPAPDLQPSTPAAHGSETEKIAVMAFVNILGQCLKGAKQLGKLWENIDAAFKQKSFRDVLQSLGNEDQNLRDIVSDAIWKIAAAAAIECGTALNEIVSNMALFPSFKAN